MSSCLLEWAKVSHYCSTPSRQQFSVKASSPYRPVGELQKAHSSQAPGSVPVNNALPNSKQIYEKQTVWYLAYGSNLAAETFQGRRNIRPISAVNVVVPSLRLAFDLPGIPYSEPCFANSAVRDGYDPPTTGMTTLVRSEKAINLPPYHKDRWPKGLVGVAYELTPSDYAHVIATEGAGAAYQDVIVECYVLPEDSDNVPNEPDTDPLKVHTLFAPPEMSCRQIGRLTRPDRSYAQPSARYLKLLTDGAKEHSLPPDYQTYLQQIRPYRVTTSRQHVGRFIFLSVWSPVFIAVLTMMSLFTDKNGKAPTWLVRLVSVIFTACWKSYDALFQSVFGDGERTENEGPGFRSTKHGLLYDAHGDCDASNQRFSEKPSLEIV